MAPITFDRNGFYADAGLRIQLHRRRLAKTQAEVAAALGVPRATYANVERGRQRVPVDLVWRIAVLFGTSIATLLPEPIPGGRVGGEGESLSTGTDLLAYRLPSSSTVISPSSSSQSVKSGR